MNIRPESGQTRIIRKVNIREYGSKRISIAKHYRGRGMIRKYGTMILK